MTVESRLNFKTGFNGLGVVYKLRFSYANMFAEKFKFNEHSTRFPSLPLQEAKPVAYGVDTRISSVSSQFISKRHSPRMNACSSNNFYHQTIAERDAAIAFISPRHCHFCLHSVEYAVRRPHIGTLQNRVRQYWRKDLRKTNVCLTISFMKRNRKWKHIDLDAESDVCYLTYEVATLSQTSSRKKIVSIQ